MFPRSILRSRSFIFSSTRCIMRSKLSIALAPESVVTALGSITPEVPEAAAAAARDVDAAAAAVAAGDRSGRVWQPQ